MAVTVEASANMTPSRRRLRPAISMESVGEYPQDDSRGKVALPPELKRRKPSPLCDDGDPSCHIVQKCGAAAVVDIKCVNEGAKAESSSPIPRRRLIIRSRSHGAEDASANSSKHHAPLSKPESPAESSSGRSIGSRTESSGSPTPATPLGDWDSMLLACHRARELVRRACEEASAPEALGVRAQMVACRLLQGSSLSSAGNSFREDHEVLSSTAACAALKNCGVDARDFEVSKTMAVDDFLLEIFSVQLAHAPLQEVAVDCTVELIDHLVRALPQSDAFRQSPVREGGCDEAAIGKLRPLFLQLASRFVVDGSMNPAMGRLDVEASAAAAVVLSALFVLRRHGSEMSADELLKLMHHESGVDTWSLQMGVEMTLQVFRQWKQLQRKVPNLLDTTASYCRTPNSDTVSLV